MNKILDKYTGRTINTSVGSTNRNRTTNRSIHSLVDSYTNRTVDSYINRMINAVFFWPLLSGSPTFVTSHMGSS